MKGFKCVHLNVRSLYPKITEVQQQFAGFDVIIITESWLNQTIPIGVINMPGYTVKRQDRDKFINKQEGGICCFIKEDLQYDMLPDKADLVTIVIMKLLGLLFSQEVQKRLTLLESIEYRTEK